MTRNLFRYKNIFLYASLQFCGNIEEYFAKNTEKLVVFIVMPRVKNKDNLLRIYKKSKLVKEENIRLSQNLFFYYFLWYINYLRAILKYFSKKDKVFVISSHPISFLGMTFQKLLRDVNFVLWAEYFPEINLVMRMFQKLKKYYHDRIQYACYFGDRVNKIMNGKILKTKNRKTVLWGVKPKNVQRNLSKAKFKILFVGLVKESQGLDLVFKFLKTHKNYKFKIIGVCDERLYTKYQKSFLDYGIQKQVYFPNRFFSEQELDEVSKECFVGIAPYKTNKNNGVYYVDPGKIKAYAELGLPIIMSNTSAVASYIKKFGCGEIIARKEKELEVALLKIKNNYSRYQEGLKKFNSYFFYEDYYKKAFSFLE